MNTVIYNSAFNVKAKENRSSFGNRNVGGIDRIFRLGLASILIMDILHGTGILGLEPYFTIAAIPLVLTAILAWDPVYAMFGVRTVTLRGSMEQSVITSRKLNAYAGINVGAIDRLFRATLASLLIATPFLWTEAVTIGAAVASLSGIVVMMTAIFGWDPIYEAANMHTATVDNTTAPQSSYSEPLDTFELFDEVDGDDVDILLKAA